MSKSENISLLNTSTTKQDVPAIDSSDNAYIRDAVGQKDDTVAGTSLFSKIKGIFVKTTNLPTDPADASDIYNQIYGMSGQVASIKTKTDQLTFTGSEVQSVLGVTYDSAKTASSQSSINSISGIVVNIQTIVGSNDASGIYPYTDTGGEQTVKEIATSSRKVLHGVWLDLVNMSQSGIIRCYHKIDGSNYREFKAQTFLQTSYDAQYVTLDAGITNDFKVTYTEGADEGAERNIPYEIVYDTKE